MAKLRWASALALAAAILATAAPASAAEGRVAPAKEQAEAPVLGTTSQASSARAAALSNGVHNTSTIAIGAFEVYRGDGAFYRQGKYDALIPAGRYSGFPYTAGIYVGPGYCVRVRGWLPGGGLSHVEWGYGEDWVTFSTNYPGFDVRALPSNNSGCWIA